MIEVGAYVEIKPAYSSETDSRSIYDEIAGLAGRIVAVHPHLDRVDVELLSGEIVDHVHVDRLKLRAPT